ncbi:hypothetical protein [Cellulosimicrobium cellulans]|uniref:hypothetical protein n=1 Tax=Cellulosimicrobium cellulans TaxID=1710 RepID=UPI002097EF5C|nr:hypothetical protein [Cellulosimicrobium cellulans]MCO7274103.1 hypothetical protein [Cellulosimicrobium cellulans]
MGRRGRRASDRRARAVLVPATALLLLVVSVAAIGGVLLGRVLDRSVPAVEDGWRAWRGVDEDDERYVADLVADAGTWPGTGDVTGPDRIGRGFLEPTVRVALSVTVDEQPSRPDLDALSERICGSTRAGEAQGFEVSVLLVRDDALVDVRCLDPAGAPLVAAVLAGAFATASGDLDLLGASVFVPEPPAEPRPDQPGGASVRMTLTPTGHEVAGPAVQRWVLLAREVGFSTVDVRVGDA